MRENGLVRRTISFFLAFTMVFSLCTNFNLTVNAETASDSLSQEGSETGSGDASSNDLQNLENTPAVASNDFQEGDTPSILGGSDSNYYDLSDYLNWEGDNSSSIKINGKELTEGGTTKVTAGDSVEITLGWNFADGSVPTSEKDVLVYTIPEGIQMADKTGTLYFGQQNVGTYQISGNKISLLYTDKAFFEEGSRGGKLEISGILSEKVIQEATKETYTFSFPGSKTFTIDMDKDHSRDGVTVTKKSAKLNDANGLNNLTADFVVAIKTVGDYKNVVFQDKMGSYLSLKGEVSFYTDESCSTPYTGSVSKDADQPSNGFKYTIAELSDQTIYAKYTVNVDKKIYTITNIYDGNQTGTITNTAKVKTEDGKENSSSARVEFDPCSWVTKTGSYNSTTEQIDWTITINKGGNFDISGTTLKDVISDKTCELVAGSFKTNIDGLTYEKLLAGSYVFPEGSTGEYTISYSTTKGTTSETSAVTKKNTVTVKPWGDSSEISGEASVQIGKNWDYVDKECLTSGNSQTVDWKITVHVPTTGIENLLVQEFIPDGMSYVDGSLKDVSGFNGTVSVTKDPYNSNAYNFTFGKIEGTGKAFDISFQIQTKIDQLPSSNKTYTNKVEVNHVQDTASYEYKFENYLEKTVNNGRITDGKMNWYLHVKQLPSTSETAVIKDTLPDGMSYVEGSLKTSYQLHWGFDEQTVYPIGVDRSDINVSVNGKVVTITLTGTALSYAKTHGDLWIRYTTKEELNISDAGTTKTYKNEANITVGNVTFPTVSAEVSHQIDKETFIDKYAEYNKDTAPYVNYTITVNEKGLTLSSDNQLTLIDQLGSALDYKEGSLKIDGVAASSSQLSYDAAKRQLTITVSDGVKHTITYQAAVNLNVGEKLDENNASNNVTLTGKVEKEVEKKTALVGSVVDSSGSSWSTGVSVSVYKYDAADRTKALEGAEFTVYKITLNANNEVTGKEKVKTVKTGADGYASISGLYRNTLYMLQETDAPDGYKGSLSAQYFAFAEKDKEVIVPTTITAAGLTEKVLIIDGSHRSYNFSVANEEFKSGSLTFTKTIKGDVTGEDLKNIEFTVKKGTEKVKTVKLSEMTKDANGKYSCTLNGLEPGEYSVTESNAEVAGYNVKVSYSVTDGKTTVEDQKTATVDITNEYTKQSGSLTFTKTIKGDVTGEDLKNIEFTVKKGTEKVKTVKLSEMTKDANGKYSCTLNGLEPGEYSVTESNAEVAGYNVKVSYSVADGKTTVEDQKTAAVDITNEYTKQSGSLTFTKTIKGDVTGEDLKNIEFTVKKGTEKVKTVKLSEMTKDANGKYSCTLNGLEPGEYSVTESNAEVAGYNVKVSYSVADGKTTVEDQKTAAVDITNEYTKQSGSLTFTKTIKGDVTGEDLKNIEFTVKKGTEKVKTVKLSEMTKDANGKYSCTLSGLEPGEYSVTESNAEVAGYNVKVSYSVADGKTTVEDQKTAAVDITNEYTKQSGSLTFTKTIKGDVTGEDLKNIEFTVKKGTEKVKTVKLSEMTKDANGKYSCTLNGLEPGEYSVTESNAEVAGYNVKVSYSVTDGKTTVEDQKTATVDITNEYTKQSGSLTFTKTIKGDVTGEDLKNIEFTVKKGTEKVKTVKLSEMTKDANGKYSCTLNGLEPGEYSVTESNAEVAGYNVKVSYSVADGKTTVEDQKTAAVDITNEYTKQSGSLTFTKTIKGDVTGEDLKNIEFTVKKGTEKVKTVKLSEMTKDANGKYSCTLNGLEPGEYSVTESNAEVAGYNVKVSYSVADGKTTVEDQKTAAVDITNEYTKQSGSLTFTKTIKGDVTGEDLKNIEFTVKKGTEKVKTVKLSEMTKDANGKYSCTLSGLEPGEYSVTESNAEVAGYNVKVSYSVADGKTTVEDQKTAAVDITNEYTKQSGSLTFTKTIKGDVTGEDLKNIEFTVKKGTEKVKTVKLSEMTKDANGKYSCTLNGLEPGEYSVTESNAEVAGYNVKVSYSVTDGKTTVEDQKTATVDITNEYTKQSGSLTFTKTIKGDVTGEDLKNIEFTVKKGTEKVKTVKLSEMTKDANGKYSCTLSGLEPGEYSVTESNAEVAGYNVKVSYSVTDGKTTVEDQKTAAVDITDEYTKVPHDIDISKVDATNGKELAGAQLTLTDADGKTVESWISDGSKHTVKIPAGTYTLTEDQAPLGYFKAESITFTVDTEGTVYIDGESDLYPNRVVMQDKRNPDEYGGGKHDVEISKIDTGNGKELEGAQLTVKDSEGNVVETWTSEGKSHVVKVPAGEYTLTEDQAPLGYEKAETITFTVDEKGKITVGGKEVTKVTMEDARTTKEVEISKVDATNSKELSGAKLKITDADGNVIDEWTSGKETHFVKLSYGEYTLTEITAPKGYEVAESITFTVGKDGKISSTTQGAVDNMKVTMKDEPSIDSNSEKPKKTTGNTTTGNNNNGTTSSTGNSSRTNTSAPKTGDFDTPQTWFLLMMLALAGIGTAGYGYKKRK